MPRALRRTGRPRRPAKPSRSPRRRSTSSSFAAQDSPSRIARRYRFVVPDALGAHPPSGLHPKGYPRDRARCDRRSRIVALTSTRTSSERSRAELEYGVACVSGTNGKTQRPDARDIYAHAGWIHPHRSDATNLDRRRRRSAPRAQLVGSGAGGTWIFRSMRRRSRAPSAGCSRALVVVTRSLPRDGPLLRARYAREEDRRRARRASRTTDARVSTPTIRSFANLGGAAGQRRRFFGVDDPNVRRGRPQAISERDALSRCKSPLKYAVRPAPRGERSCPSCGLIPPAARCIGDEGRARAEGSRSASRDGGGASSSRWRFRSRLYNALQRLAALARHGPSISDFRASARSPTSAPLLEGSRRSTQGQDARPSS